MAGGRIKGITVEIGGDTTKLQTALKGVNSEIKNTQSQLKDVERLLKLDPGNTELLAQKQKNLATEISATKEKLETLKTAAEQANDALARGDISQEQYDALQREIAETEQQLKSLENEYRDFGSVAAQQIANVGEKMKTLGEGIADVGSTLTKTVTLPIVAAGTAAATKFAEVDKTMQLTNATMGNTEEQAKLLNDAMSEAAANSTFGMSDAATATLNFARAGLDAEQAAAALAPAMNLAAGEGGSLDTVSAGLVATINGFHGSFDDAAHYADVFAAACNNSALDVDSLSGAMSVAAPVFSAAGYYVNDAALYMGVMANNGIEADKAANSLKTGMARLISPAKEGAEMMDQLGISVTNADGSMKDSITIQSDLHAAFSQLSESEQIAAASAIFGKNQMAPWLALINTAPSDVDALSDSLTNCAGTTTEMADAMMSGFGGSIEKLKSSIDVLLTNLGSSFFTSIWNTIKSTFTTVVNAIKSFLSDAWNSIKSTITTVMNAISSTISTVWNTIKTTVTTIVNNIKSTVTTTWNNIKSSVSSTVEGIKSTVTTAFTNMWNGIKSTITNIYNTIVNGFNNAVNWIKDLATDAWNWGADIINNIVDGIKSGISSVTSAVSEVANTISSYLHFSVPYVGPLSTFESWMPDFMGGLAKGIRKTRGIVKDAIGEVAADMTISPRLAALEGADGSGSRSTVNHTGTIRVEGVSDSGIAIANTALSKMNGPH